MKVADRSSALKKPAWIDDSLAARYEIAFSSGPSASGHEWRPTEIREISGTRVEVSCVFASRLRGEQVINIPTKMLDDELFLAAVWDRLEQLG